MPVMIFSRPWLIVSEIAAALAVVARPMDAGALEPTGRTYVVAASGRYPDVTATGNDGFVVVWGDTVPGGEAVVGQRFGREGEPRGPIFPVSPGLGGAPGIGADASGNLVATWFGISEITAQRFDITGQPRGQPFDIATGLSIIDMDVGVDAAGNFVVAWADYKTDASPPCFDASFDLLGQGYDSSATPLGPRFLISPCLGFGGDPISVAGGGPGEFLVVWKERLRGSYGRLFDGRGTPKADPFALDNGVHADRDANGDFVLTWNRKAAVAGVNEVVVERFSSQPGERPQEVVTTSTGYRGALAVQGTTNPFVVVWQEYPEGVTLQRYCTDVRCSSTTTPTTTTTTIPASSCSTLPVCQDALHLILSMQGTADDAKTVKVTKKLLALFDKATRNADIAAASTGNRKAKLYRKVRAKLRTLTIVARKADRKGRLASPLASIEAAVNALLALMPT